MKKLIKHILREQDEGITGVPEFTEYDAKVQKHVTQPGISKTIFFKTTKQLLKSNPEMFGGEYSLESLYDRGNDMSNVLKLFGININNEGLTSKIYWAAFDNKKGILDGSINRYDELNLRPLKEYKVTCEENATEHKWYTWQPIVEAYDRYDAEQQVYYDDDGFYSWYEWDNKPGFDEESGDYESDGKEIVGIVEVSDKAAPTSDDLKEHTHSLQEENRVMGGVKGFDGKEKTYHSWDPQIFFKVTQEIIDSATPEKSLLDEMNHEPTWERYEVFKPILNLFGITQDEFGWDADSLINKLFWVIKDNYDGIKDGTITNFDQLDLRPIQTFKADMQENAVEHVTHYWSPIMEAYDADDVVSAIMHDEDGEYNHFEWEDEPGYERGIDDYDSDGGEVLDVYTIDASQKPSRLTESESPDENELVDGLRKILHKQKEAHSEDRWYDDIEKLLKRLNIPLNENFVSHSYEPNIGDNVKNNNPGCIHYGSEGVIEDIDDLPDEIGKTITYRVTNDGENYENGDTLTKTMDQLIPLQESVL